MLQTSLMGRTRERTARAGETVTWGSHNEHRANQAVGGRAAAAYGRDSPGAEVISLDEVRRRKLVRRSFAHARSRPPPERRRRDDDLTMDAYARRRCGISCVAERHAQSGLAKPAVLGLPAIPPPGRPTGAPWAPTWRPRQEAGGFLGTSGKARPWRGQGAPGPDPVTPLSGRC